MDNPFKNILYLIPLNVFNVDMYVTDGKKMSWDPLPKISFYTCYTNNKAILKTQTFGAFLEKCVFVNLSILKKVPKYVIFSCFYQKHNLNSHTIVEIQFSI